MNAPFELTELANGAHELTTTETGEALGQVQPLLGTTRWVAVMPDGTAEGPFSGRYAAAQSLYNRYADQRASRRGGPGSHLALARELHATRRHPSPLRHQINWLCSCNRDALELSSTKWLQTKVAEALEVSR